MARSYAGALLRRVVVRVTGSVSLESWRDVYIDAGAITLVVRTCGQRMGAGVVRTEVAGHLAQVHRYDIASVRPMLRGGVELKAARATRDEKQRRRERGTESDG